MGNDMSCGFDRERLTAFYDGELGAEEKSEIEAHIASCSECLRDLGEVKAASLAVRELPRHHVPPAVLAGVTRGIREEAVRRRTLLFRRVLHGSIAAAALVLLVVGLALMENSPRDSAQLAMERREAGPERDRSRGVGTLELSSAGAEAPSPPAPRTLREPSGMVPDAHDGRMPEEERKKDLEKTEESPPDFDAMAKAREQGGGKFAEDEERVEARPARQAPAEEPATPPALEREEPKAERGDSESGNEDADPTAATPVALHLTVEGSSVPEARRAVEELLRRQKVESFGKTKKLSAAESKAQPADPNPPLEVECTVEQLVRLLRDLPKSGVTLTRAELEDKQSEKKGEEHLLARLGVSDALRKQLDESVKRRGEYSPASAGARGRSEEGADPAKDDRDEIKEEKAAALSTPDGGQNEANAPKEGGERMKEAAPPAPAAGESEPLPRRVRLVLRFQERPAAVDPAETKKEPEKK